MNMKIALLTAACALALSACGDRSAPPADSTATAPAAQTATPAPMPEATPAETAPADAHADMPGEAMEPAATETPATVPADTGAAAADTASPAPAADSNEAAAASCAVEIESNDAIQYNVKEITVPASCSEFTITMRHVGKLPVAAMGHNVVITTAADMAGVVADGIAAGLDAGYLKPNDSRVIAHTDMIGGGQTTSVTFPVSKIKGGEYRFFCSFPGHAALMNGTISVK